MAAVHPISSGATTQDRRREHRMGFAWRPVALLGAGLLLGLALWAKWGFAIAFEAIRTYCF